MIDCGIIGTYVRNSSVLESGTQWMNRIPHQNAVGTKSSRDAATWIIMVHLCRDLLLPVQYTRDVGT